MGRLAFIKVELEMTSSYFFPTRQEIEIYVRECRNKKDLLPNNILKNEAERDPKDILHNANHNLCSRYGKIVGRRRIFWYNPHLIIKLLLNIF